MRRPSAVRTSLSAFVVLLALVLVRPTWAWSDHTLISYPLLVAMSEVTGRAPVKAEGLASFLIAEETKVARLLLAEERWDRANLAWYPPRPAAIAFTATGNRNDVVKRFCHAIRINPSSRLNLFLHLLPGAEAAGRPVLAPKDVSILKDLSSYVSSTFVALEEGEEVRPIDVATSANDDPDNGLDVGLFEDNGTAFGRTYGFGRQPFGNPNLDYGSQAPFHMGYYHESPVLYDLAGFLKKTYPEYRIHLYRRLAELAFKTGHDYWGWRFAGWGMHYLADLSNPYHSRVFPCVSTARLITINTLDAICIHGPEKTAVQLVSNRHLALEEFARSVLVSAYLRNDLDQPILVALRREPARVAWTDGAPRDAISRYACDRADRTAALIARDMPSRFVNDPDFELGTSPERFEIVERVRAEHGQPAVDALSAQCADLLSIFATYGRAYLRAIVSGK